MSIPPDMPAGPSPQPEPPSVPPEREPVSPPARDFHDFFSALDSCFARELTKASELADLSRRQIAQILAKGQDQLGSCQSRLQGAFTASPGKTGLTGEQLQQYIAEVETVLGEIFEQIRPEIDRDLRQLSPRRQPLGGFLKRLDAGYRKAADRLPDLVRERTAGDIQTEENTHRLSDLLARTEARGRDLANRALEVVEKNLQLTPRKLALAELSSLPTVDQSPVAKRYQTAYEESIGRLADLWRGIRFHLEVAAIDLNNLATQTSRAEQVSKLQEIERLAVEALQDGSSKLANALKPLDYLLDGLAEDLRLDHADVVKRLHETLDQVETWGIVSDHALHWSLRRARQLVGQGEELIARGKTEMSRSATSGLAQSGNLLHNLQEMLGVVGKPAEALLAFADLPNLNRILTHAGELPELYRRLFTIGPLRHREFLVGREEELEQLEDAFARWEEKKACSVALIGPEGSGKTSLLNCFARENSRRAPFVFAELTGRMQSEADLVKFFTGVFEMAKTPEDVPALIDHLLAGPRRVILVENGHLLGLRTIGGMQAAHAFIQLILATQRHCLWVVSFRGYAWRRLDHLLGISQFFTHHQQALFHRAGELREAILLRHRTADLPLRFLPEETSEPEDDQKTLEDRYFTNLFNISGGNVETAICFWVGSLTFHADDKTLDVAPLIHPNTNFLKALGKSYLFAMAEVVSHGELTVDEYCAIFRQQKSSGQVVLDYLSHLNLLISERRDGIVSYRLNPLFQVQVTRQLELMNILY